MTWLAEHVRNRYASGHVIVIPADHRGYEHRVELPVGARINSIRIGDSTNPLCVTLRGASPPPICDCGMYALDWTATP